MAIKAIVGLGNPGEKYVKTRHNAGFWLIDELVRQYGGEAKAEKKLHGEFAQISLANHVLKLLKPSTFMNKSGDAVQALAQFYKLHPKEILIAHDEIDLPPGKAKFKHGGGHGGHNGLRDIIRHLGGDFPRLRLGVGHPGSRDAVIGYVLHAAGKAEQAELDAMTDRAANAIPILVAEGMEAAMLNLHTQNTSE